MKERSPRFLAELIFAICAAVFGLGIAAGFAPHDSWLFWPNLGFYWLPQAAVLGILFCFFKPSPAMFGGIAVALGCYLGAFATWLFTRSHPESMAWLGFYFSLPGALIGGVLAGALASDRPLISPVASALLGFGLVIGGIAVNQAIVCSTAMYCLGD